MPSRCARGSSLLEAVIASGLLATVLTGVVPLVTTAVAGTAAARSDFTAAHLSRQRLAELQTLTHVRVPTGVIVSTQAFPSPQLDARATAVRPARPRSIVPPTLPAAIGSAC